jgi:hypothetical protein
LAPEEKSELSYKGLSGVRLAVNRPPKPSPRRSLLSKLESNQMFSMAERGGFENPEKVDDPKKE